MRIQTMSCVVDAPCRGTCPYCVSRMTGRDEHTDEDEMDAHAITNLARAMMLAEIGGVTTALITSKGEPFRNVKAVANYAVICSKSFPFVEVQTNGLPFDDELQEKGAERFLESLKSMHDNGLSTVAISVVSDDPETNRKIICNNRESYIDLPKIIELLKEAGLVVRLTCTMFRSAMQELMGFADEHYAASVEDFSGVMRLVEFCREHGVEQLSFGPVTAPEVSADDAVRVWVNEHQLPSFAAGDILHQAKLCGTHLMTLPHGAVIYDISGISVCFRDCLSIDPASDELRQIIYFPDGRVTYDWRYKGAVLL